MKRLFSVIIPIYNIENYIGEAIDSVINQSLNFEKNIEIILVDDGSTDNSSEVCQRYVKKYPKNIYYLRQENAGVSAARNNGLEHACGEFVNFLDGDDKWSSDAFEKVAKMFRENSALNIIGVRQKFFEGRNDYHVLDYKFNRDKIVNIQKDYDQIQMSSTSSFVRRSAIGNTRFCTKLKYAEDARFCTEIVMKNCLLGLIASSQHLYRKRMMGNSAIQTSTADKSWWLDVLSESHQYIVKLSEKKFGRIIPYVQYMIAYDMQWRANIEEIPYALSEQERTQYNERAWRIWKQVDDHIILEQRFLSLERKQKIIEQKYDNVAKYEKARQAGEWTIDGIKIEDNARIWLSALNERRDGGLTICGTVILFAPTKSIKLYAVVDGRRYPLELDEEISTKIVLFAKKYNSFPFFRFEAPKGAREISFIVKTLAGEERTLILEFNNRGRLSLEWKVPYCTKQKIYYVDEECKSILSKPATLRNKLRKKGRQYKTLLDKDRREDFLLRVAAEFIKIIYKKKIWLISDSKNRAGDNGQVFFEFLRRERRGIRSYFAIGKESPDYQKLMAAYGRRVLAFGSRKHKLIYCLAHKIISSQITSEVVPFNDNEKFFNDAAGKPIVFLQHGVIQGGVASYCNRYESNINCFISSAERERDEILGKAYGYEPKEVVLTGLPRFDLLEKQKTEKIILLMPTWRSYIKSDQDFLRSEYYKFYNDLLHDKRIIKAAKQKGYKLLFKPHSNMLAYKAYFEPFDECIMDGGDISYTDAFNRSALCISDYSSAIFDFAYLEKPVIYAQFDLDQVGECHSAKHGTGYFKYDRDGFGPVEKTYEATVEAILRQLKDGVKMEDKYKKRVEKFFAFHDHKNCERVLDAILKSD